MSQREMLHLLQHENTILRELQRRKDELLEAQRRELYEVYLGLYNATAHCSQLLGRVQQMAQTSTIPPASQWYPHPQPPLCRRMTTPPPLQKQPTLVVSPVAPPSSPLPSAESHPSTLLWMMKHESFQPAQH